MLVELVIIKQNIDLQWDRTSVSVTSRMTLKHCVGRPSLFTYHGLFQGHTRHWQT